VPHQIIQLDKSTRYFVFHFPLTCFLQWQLMPNFSRQVLQGDLLTMPVEDENFQLAQCERWHHHIQADTAEHHKIALLEIEACLRLMALSSEAPAPADPLDLQTGIDSIAKMASFITENFQEPLTVTRIAEGVNLHPNYAMQLFRQHTGRTLISYLTQYRIAHAQHLLLTTNKTVLDIALESGFSSLSRFYAVFKEFCYIPPTRYRQSLRL
jgi:AraC-like DNA-binding protein